MNRGQEYRENADINDLLEINELDFEGSAKSDDAPKKKKLLKTTLLSQCKEMAKHPPTFYFFDKLLQKILYRL